MKIVISRLATFTIVAVLTSTSLANANSATNLLNKPCPKVEATKVNSGLKLICKSIAGKKVWKKATDTAPDKVVKLVPLTVPEFNLQYESSILTATLIVNEDKVKQESIESAEAIVYAKVDGNYKRIGSTNWNTSKLPGPGEWDLKLSFYIAKEYQGKEVAVEFRYTNLAGQGKKALKAITVPSPTPTINTSPSPSASPAPTATTIPTPSPVTSAAPNAEAGCSVNYLSPLPYASQRMSITNMAWEKDSLGYVSVNMSIRNDNSMALRLVEFTFYLMHKGSIITTTSTLEGNHHFYIQDDVKFNSTDGIRGAWMPGQTRVFKIPTNQMLECKSISVLSSGYTVKQGIGAR